MLSTLPTLETAIPALLRECSTLSGDFESTTPILLTRQRSERRDWLTERWSVVDAELSRVLEMQGALASASRLLASYRTRLAHARSPVSALPIELLESILQLICSPENDDDDLSPLIPWHLSHVCSRWRSLVLSIPKIWSVIPIKASTKDEFLLEYAARAREAPLVLRSIDLKNQGLWDHLPWAIHSRITTVQLTQLVPLWADHLRMHWSGETLETVRLGPTIPRKGEIGFCLDECDSNSALRKAQTLVCRDAYLWSHYDVLDRDERPKFQFQSLKLESVMPQDAISTLCSVWGSPLASLWLSDVRVEEDIKPLEDKSDTTAGLRTLHVIGNDISVETAGVILAQCKIPKRLESLDIEINGDTGADPDRLDNDLIHVVRSRKFLPLCLPRHLTRLTRGFCQTPTNASSLLLGMPPSSDSRLLCSHSPT